MLDLTLKRPPVHQLLLQNGYLIPWVRAVRCDAGPITAGVPLAVKLICLNCVSPGAAGWGSFLTGVRQCIVVGSPPPRDLHSSLKAEDICPGA